MEQQAQKQFGYQTMQLIKTETLGKGSYGAVYKAMYDDLPCAGKVLHPTLFQHNDPGEKRAIEKFQQECSFLSRIRHPNIVQYLGVGDDPETQLPVLLMELMDDSLTNFLQLSEEPLPYHTQVNLCQDIALALAFLHSNEIIHRDLSSNNVLLIGAANRAKITDFGNAKLFDPMIPLTRCPGTKVYMSPEALDDPTVYNKKLDAFSFGVLVIQIITRRFPNPVPRIRKIIDPDDPRHGLQEVVPETERRKSHIDLINHTHPLLPIASNCLSDNEESRPAAQVLCHSLAALKKSSKYVESVKNAEEKSGLAHGTAELVDRDERERQWGIQATERELQELNQQLAASRQKVAQLEQNLQKRDKMIQELQEINPHSQLEQDLQQKKKLKLSWKLCNPAPDQMLRGSTTECGSMAYFRPNASSKVYSYNSDTEVWSTLPDCFRMYFTLTVANGHVTAVGGRSQPQRQFTNTLLSLVPREGGKWKWVEHFPPMPTKRVFTAVVCSGKALVVAGGWVEENNGLNTVEVMNIDTQQWSTASSLPHSLYYATATVCGDKLYLTAGWDEKRDTKSAITCSLSALLQSQTTESVWHTIAPLPVTDSTCVMLNGQLLAVGGRDSDQNYSNTIYSYNTQMNSWEIISHMPTPRSWCLLAVLPRNQLMVVGGEINTEKSNKNMLDNVEVATVQ